MEENSKEEHIEIAKQGGELCVLSRKLKRTQSKLRKWASSKYEGNQTSAKRVNQSRHRKKKRERDWEEQVEGPRRMIEMRSER